MKKIPVQEIRMEMAKKTITNQHEQFGKTIGVNGCFGMSPPMKYGPTQHR